MKKKLFSLMMLVSIATVVFSQDQSTITKPRSYEVKQAFEVESLVPMFFTGGYHFAIGYRYDKFRVRASVINGGSYNAETAGINNHSDDFKRFYKTSPGIFLGYNVWKNLELYGFAEFHTFSIQQRSTRIEKDIHTVDLGGGVGYQFFIGRYFYIQPALHIYCRKDHRLDFEGTKYNISNIDFSPVLRLGVRLWSK
ncbi:hypothetical protein G7051_08310 [Dysgonomonas sp. HDW5B]|uniref:hypothetical protein n=1 Tax=Dysgonomonas sp. HDW5B TaxID=2714927 RepID=UPI001409EB22|nr:hypothetical protein [Dysgonomonas sp. HDW5B]QIK54342.1 hypothetical protein G7051_08310 [Dysgonomonas sp. HDW5B]